MPGRRYSTGSDQSHNHLKGSTQRCKSNTPCCTVAYLYTYDSLGRLIHSEQVENGNTVLRTSQRYNENNQLTGQSWQLGSTAYSEGYTYNSEDGSLNTRTTGVGTTLTMGYDGLRRLTSVTGGPVSRQYTYRDVDSVKTTMQVASVTSGGIPAASYCCDAWGKILWSSGELAELNPLRYCSYVYDQETERNGGIKLGNTKILSPDAAWQKNNGGTLRKVGKTFRIDVGSNTFSEAICREYIPHYPPNT